METMNIWSEGLISTDGFESPITADYPYIDPSVPKKVYEKEHKCKC